MQHVLHTTRVTGEEEGERRRLDRAQDTAPLLPVDLSPPTYATPTYPTPSAAGQYVTSHNPFDALPAGYSPQHVPLQRMERPKDERIDFTSFHQHLAHELRDRHASAHPTEEHLPLYDTHVVQLHDVADDDFDQTTLHESRHSNLDGASRPSNGSATCGSVHGKEHEERDPESGRCRHRSTQSDGSPKPLFAGMGLLLMVFASALSCAWGICIKMLAGIGTSKNYGITTFQVVFIRSFATGLISAAILKYTKVGLVGPWIKNKGATRDMIVRAVAGFTSVSSSTWTQTVLPLGESTVLSFLAPIFTGILAAIFLKETYELLDILAGVIAMCGVVLVARPPFLFPSASQQTDIPIINDPESDVPVTEAPTESPPATFKGIPIRIIATNMAIAAAFLAAVVSVQVRKMGKMIPALQIVMFYNVSSTILCVLVSIAMRKPWAMPSDAISWTLVMLISVMGFLQQWAFTKAMTIEKASKASSMGYVQVILAFIADYFVFGHVPDTLALIGASFVGVSVITIGVVKWRKGK